MLYLSLMKNRNRNYLRLRSPYLKVGHSVVVQKYKDKHVISLNKWLLEPIRTRIAQKRVFSVLLTVTDSKMDYRWSVVPPLVSSALGHNKRLLTFNKG